MPTNNLYIFDAYGTLFDVNSAVMRHAHAFGNDAKPFADMWRAKQLEYTWVLALAQCYESFWSLTQKSLDFTFAKFPQVDRTVRDALLDAYRTLSAYPEVAHTLAGLRERGASTGILSNGDTNMLHEAIHASQLDGFFDAVISVDEVRVFKTDPRTYALVTKAFDVVANGVTFVSSNRWDAAGAKAFGFSPVWVNRANAPDEYPDLPPTKMVADLAGLLADERVERL